MTKCFFYLEQSSYTPVASLGLFYLDQQTACTYAQAFVDALARQRSSLSLTVVVKDQFGEELGRARPTKHAVDADFGKPPTKRMELALKPRD